MKPRILDCNIHQGKGAHILAELDRDSRFLLAMRNGGQLELVCTRMSQRPGSAVGGTHSKAWLVSGQVLACKCWCKSLVQGSKHLVSVTQAGVGVENWLGRFFSSSFFSFPPPFFLSPSSRPLLPFLFFPSLPFPFLPLLHPFCTSPHSLYSLLILSFCLTPLFPSLLHHSRTHQSQHTPPTQTWSSSPVFDQHLKWLQILSLLI